MNTHFRIAMVGPLPPERSGIAEYSAGLVAMLRDAGLRVITVTRGDVEREGVGKIVDALLAVDVVVYQMGNHPAFHGWMLPLMAYVPGVVHLHDLVLHHMVAGVLSDEGRLLNEGYSEVLGHWHSDMEVKSSVLALRCGAPIWTRDEVVRFPLHQVAVKFATEVVVHSNYSSKRIVEEFPWLPVTVVPQLYPVVAPHRVRERLDTIAVMGGGQANRRFDWIVDALVSLDSELDRPLVLEVAGEVEPVVRRQLEGLTALKNVRLIEHGRVDDDQFWSVFERADLMIALRQPTMGEASAVVSKALQAGLPTVVSDHGWYAELPGCVKKIEPTSGCPRALSELLRHLIMDEGAYVQWAEVCSDQAGRPTLDPLASAEQYARVLRSNWVFSSFRDRIAKMVVDLKIDIDSPLSSELQRVDVMSMLRGDSWLTKALEGLDARELDSHARSTGNLTGPYPYSEPLPAEAFKGQLVVIESDSDPVQPSSMISVRIGVTNDSPNPWFSPPGHSVRPFGIYIGHFWHSCDPVHPVAEQPRQWIDEAIAPMSFGEQVITVRAPETPGEYQLEIDLVQEAVAWFRDREFVPARLTVTVASSKA